MTTDTSEKGLETLIMRDMTGIDGLLPPKADRVAEAPPQYGGAGKGGGNGWLAGWAGDFDRTHALDLWQLFAFLRATQTETLAKLGVKNWLDTGDVARRNFLVRLSAEVGKRGVIDVLRKGIEHGPLHFDLCYGTPSPGNQKATALHAQNRFSVTRQVRYSNDERQRALDLCLFVNAETRQAVEHPEDVQRAVRHALLRRGPGGATHPRRHRPPGGCGSRLPERQEEHARRCAHRARQGAGQGDADAAQGRH